MTAGKKKNASHTWRAILAGRKALRAGIDQKNWRWNINENLGRSMTIVRYWKQTNLQEGWRNSNYGC
jgi:hypothetical protein